MVRLSGAFILLLATLTPMPLHGAAWLVEPDGSGDAPTIQAGIDSAETGDIVELADGVFVGEGNFDLTIAFKNITIRSASGDPFSCVVDAESNGRGLAVLATVDSSTTATVSGLTFRNGQSDAGAGIYSYRAALTLNDCIFESNIATNGAGGLHLHRTSGTATRCELVANTGSIGGGVHLRTSPFEFYECSFTENIGVLGGAMAGRGGAAGSFYDCHFSNNEAQDGGGAYLELGATPYFERCSFIENRASFNGGGMHMRASSTAIFLRCLFIKNTAGQFGAALHARESSSATLEGTIIAWSVHGTTIHCIDLESTPTLECCDVFGNAEGDWTGCISDQFGVSGNFSADPIFCDSSVSDFNLHANSPCAPGNHPDGASCGIIGALPVACGGSTATEEVSWGAVKEMFR